LIYKIKDLPLSETANMNAFFKNFQHSLIKRFVFKGGDPDNYPVKLSDYFDGIHNLHVTDEVGIINWHLGVSHVEWLFSQFYDVKTLDISFNIIEMDNLLQLDNNLTYTIQKLEIRGIEKSDGSLWDEESYSILFSKLVETNLIQTLKKVVIDNDMEKEITKEMLIELGFDQDIQVKYL
jgi:hypothetical protein